MIVAEIDYPPGDWLLQLDQLPWAYRTLTAEPIIVNDDYSGTVGLYLVEPLPWERVENIQATIKEHVPASRLRLESRASYQRRLGFDRHAKAMGMPPRSGRVRVVEEVRLVVPVPEAKTTRFEREPVI